MNKNKWEAWVAKIDAMPKNDPALMDAIYNCYDYISCLSEAILACGYNDTTILERLRDGTLDESAARGGVCGWNGKTHGDMHWFEAQIGDYRREDGQYEKQLMEMVEAAGGWPFTHNYVIGITKRLTTTNSELYQELNDLDYD
jgi:hypothetical protein